MEENSPQEIGDKGIEPKRSWNPYSQDFYVMDTEELLIGRIIAAMLVLACTYAAAVWIP